MPGKFINNPYYLEYESLLRQLHEIIAAGKGDSDEADAVRDKMDTPWLNLSRDEIDRLNGLSADLYMLQDDEVFEKYEGTQEQLRAELSSAWANRDWVLLLALLRKGPVHIPQEGTASLRAQAYEELGQIDTARLFVDYAARLNPKEASYKTRELHLLMKSHCFSEALQSATVYIKDESSPADLLIIAVNVLHDCARYLPERAIELYGQVTAISKRIISNEQAFAVLPSALKVITLAALGDSCQKQGLWSEALDAYDQAIRVEPGNTEIFAARGLLRAKLGLPGAVSDLEQAVDSSTNSPYPYLNLARYALVERDYERAIEMCDRVTGLTQNPRVLAAALDMKAIALFEQGQDSALIVATFARAFSLDPLNEVIQHNYDVSRQMGLDASLWTFQPPTEKTFEFYDKAA